MSAMSQSRRSRRGGGILAPSRVTLNLIEERVCQAHVSLVAFNRHLRLSNWGALNAGNCNHPDRWLRTRIRCSRVALPPKASSGETAAGSFWDITLLGMTRFAQIAIVPRPRATTFSTGCTIRSIWVANASKAWRISSMYGCRS